MKQRLFSVGRSPAASTASTASYLLPPAWPVSVPASMPASLCPRPTCIAEDRSLCYRLCLWSLAVCKSKSTPSHKSPKSPRATHKQPRKREPHGADGDENFGCCCVFVVVFFSEAFLVRDGGVVDLYLVVIVIYKKELTPASLGRETRSASTDPGRHTDETARRIERERERQQWASSQAQRSPCTARRRRAGWCCTARPTT